MDYWLDNEMDGLEEKDLQPQTDSWSAWSYKAALCNRENIFKEDFNFSALFSGSINTVQFCKSNATYQNKDKFSVWNRL